MDKKELLMQVQDMAAQRLLTKEEVTAAFDAGIKDNNVEDERMSQIGIFHILCYIGGAIVFLGIVILICQHWHAFNNTTKILCTLGSSIAAYIIAVFLSHDKRLEIVSGTFYFLSALLMPLGLQVLFHIEGFDIGRNGIQSIISAILLLIFLLSYFINRKTIFIIFQIIFGTWLFFSFISFLVGSNPNLTWHFWMGIVLCINLVYALLGYYFAETSHRTLTGVLYGFGVFGFLGSALALGGWAPHQNVFWELAFPGIVFGIIFLSVYLRSTAFLVFGSLYLMAYILKITSEYFAQSLGWPLTLILTGLGLIAIGYLYFSLKKKYFSFPILTTPKSRI